MNASRICSLTGIMTAALVFVVSAHAAAYRLQSSDDTFLDINLLLQAQGQLIQEGAPDKASWGKEFFIRRARIILSGNVTKNIGFFIDTDMPNWGKGNEWGKPEFVVQDAFISFKVVDEFMVDGGMLISPFSRHGYQSAVSMLATEYHSDMIRYPADSTRAWRDAGAQVRGYLFGKKLQYRLAVVNGSKNDVLQKDRDGNAVVKTNPHDYPRVTAHLRYNVFGTETDMFSKGIYFADKPILSFGASFDYQQDAGLDRAATFEKDGTGKETTEILAAGELGKYMAASADFFAEIPFAGSDHEFIIHGAYYKYWLGKASKATGMGGYAEFGYRYKVFSPIVGFDYFHGDMNGQDMVAIKADLVWWAKKHNANLKLNATVRKDGDISKADFLTTLTLQGQVFF